MVIQFLFLYHHLLFLDKYKKEGLESLEKKKRVDKNEFRKIKDDSVVDKIIELREKYPRITTKKIK